MATQKLIAADFEIRRDFPSEGELLETGLLKTGY
jgi:hypothetical protein